VRGGENIAPKKLKIKKNCDLHHCFSSQAVELRATRGVAAFSTLSPRCHQKGAKVAMPAFRS
jgi:hypothetical protein